MRKGAVLLLDEVDLGSNKLMCLQSVLEGKGYLIKKTGEWVKPANGFTILATANTKGQGSEDGKFIGTQIMNEKKDVRKICNYNATRISTSDN